MSLDFFPEVKFLSDSLLRYTVLQLLARDSDVAISLQSLKKKQVLAKPKPGVFLFLPHILNIFYNNTLSFLKETAGFWRVLFFCLAIWVNRKYLGLSSLVGNDGAVFNPTIKWRADFLLQGPCRPWWDQSL